jgi:4-hydroxy-tetrahydrodipicolinate synthase
LDFHLRNHTDAIVTCATSGESPTLTPEEYSKIIDLTVRKVGGKIPVIAGAGSNSTEKTLELCKTAEALGVDGLLLVTPFYNKTSQKGLIAHYTFLAQRVQIPIIIYNVPSRTGLNVLPSTYKALSYLPMINGVKEANGNISAVSETIALCQDELNIYSGNDDQTLPMMALGAKGVISVFANCMPQEMHDLCATMLLGNLKKANELQVKYLELMNALFTDVNPIPVKEALKMMGINCGPCRLPLTEMDESKKELLKNALKSLSLL